MQYLEFRYHGRRVRGGRSLLVRLTPPPLLSVLPCLYITKILIFYYNETITLFLKQLQANFNGYSNVISGNENLKSCEFCVKILHRECREVAKKLWFW